MLDDEIKNCTFEPQVGVLSTTTRDMVKAVPELEKRRLDEESEYLGYIKTFGDNFKNSNPEIFKAGVLRQAQKLYNRGELVEAISKLEEGFNIEQLRRKFGPPPKKNAKKKMSLAEVRKTFQENVKDQVREDFEKNKKLPPIQREAWDLVQKIEEHKENVDRQVRVAKRKQLKIAELQKSVTDARTGPDRKPGEPRKDEQPASKDVTKQLYKSIMCPFKDKCSKDERGRWPTSNIRANVPFGEKCPFAHHAMELVFVEADLHTKKQAVGMALKGLDGAKERVRPQSAWRPAGELRECLGCGNPSMKHMGGPCGMC